MLNWIVWNRTFLTLKPYLRWTELFEIEQFWHLTVCKQNYTYTVLGQRELNFVLTLNWITWNRTVLIFKLCTYAKQNSLN